VFAVILNRKSFFCVCLFVNLQTQSNHDCCTLSLSLPLILSLSKSCLVFHFKYTISCMLVWRVFIISQCLIYHLSVSGCLSFFFFQIQFNLLYIFSLQPSPFRSLSLIDFSNCVWCVFVVSIWSVSHFFIQSQYYF
jgi:hypothetical protein